MKECGAKTYPVSAMRSFLYFDSLLSVGILRTDQALLV